MGGVIRPRKKAKKKNHKKKKTKKQTKQIFKKSKVIPNTINQRHKFMLFMSLILIKKKKNRQKTSNASQ